VGISQLPAECSAQRVLTAPQLAFGAAAIAVLAALLTLGPLAVIVGVLCSLCVFGALAATHQALVSAAGARPGRLDASPPTLDDEQLPAYTVLAPLYREAIAVAGLVASLGALDYPAHLLDIKLIVRVDDDETLEALARIVLPPQFELLLLPEGRPQTKPRACNFGLRHARGELVVIFDAEDRPEPDQLRKAAAVLRAAPPEVACVQARLDLWNPATNATTHHGACEYSVKWGMFSPGLERVGAPVPLGGTSNHFPLWLLLELGAWDEFNVTEDIDLGIRLSRLGMRTQMLDSVTYEEANSRLGNWIRQRTRWIKGWLQTWLVHMRHPLALTRELGARGSMHLHLTVLGSIIPPLFAPFGWTLAILWLLAHTGLLAPFLPGWLLWLAASSLLYATAIGIVSAAVALRRVGYRLPAAPLVMPFFELAKAAAAWRALWQLATRPHYWEKTAHGLEPEPGTGVEPALLTGAGRA
jgi:cellulose synthase/poly-beta-1,6-N-acetylglucosamine synthase-like glycosyltransferase